VDEEPKLRPLPPPPQCRGIPLGDGNYTGCACGYGDLAPFTGPRDCPVCNGSGFEGPIETTLPHSEFGDPECCGCLNSVIRGDQADIVCNECGTVLRTVPAANVGQTLTELEIALDVAAKCARIADRSISSRAFLGCSHSTVGSAERPFWVRSS
jgi:ribosomal protein S27E